MLEYAVHGMCHNNTQHCIINFLSQKSNWSDSVWSLASPFSSSEAQTQQYSAFPNRETASQQQSPQTSSELSTSSNNLSYLENTYDLFKDQSIWGLGSEMASSGRGSWAQPKTTTEHYSTPE